MKDSHFYATLVFGVFVALLAAGYNIDTIASFLRPVILLVLGL